MFFRAPSWGLNHPGVYLTPSAAALSLQAPVPCVWSFVRSAPGQRKQRFGHLLDRRAAWSLES